MGASLSKLRHVAVKGVMIEFTDILLTTTLPVHPLLAADLYLSVSLIEDEVIYAETPVVNGDLVTGIWEINSSLSAKSVKRLVTLAVFASRRGGRFCLASVKLSVSELLARSNARSDGYQEFNLQDPESSIQLIMTCTAKVLPSSIHGNHELDSSEPLSREFLESSYTTIVCLPDHNGLKASGLSELGRLYHTLYQKEGNGADLEKAISLHEDALECTGPLHPQLAEDAHMLSLTLMHRFEQSGDTVDIERAISYLQNAVGFTEDVDAEKPGRLNNLGIALLLRFERFGGLEDLEDAISNQQRAVELTPDGHPDKSGFLSNLGSAFDLRFKRVGSPEDLESAISSRRRANQLTPDSRPDAPSWLNSLMNTLTSRFGRPGVLKDWRMPFQATKEQLH